MKLKDLLPLIPYEEELYIRCGQRKLYSEREEFQKFYNDAFLNSDIILMTGVNGFLEIVIEQLEVTTQEPSPAF